MNCKKIILLFSGALMFFGCSITGTNNTQPDWPGLQPDPPHYILKAGFQSPPINRNDLPPSFDLSPSMGPVGDQGYGITNSCAGWAASYIKTYHEYRERNWDLALTSHRFSASYIYNQIQLGYDGGAYFAHALDILVNQGCDTLAGFPFIKEKSATQIVPDSSSKNRAASFKEEEWHYITSSVESIKSFIVAGEPVYLGIYCYDDFDAASPSNPVYDSVYGTAYGHALTAVGYDDNKHAFKIMNSYGPSWGTWRESTHPEKEKGFVWLSYDLIGNSKVHMASYVSYDIVEEHEEPDNPDDPENTTFVTPDLSSSGYKNINPFSRYYTGYDFWYVWGRVYEVKGISLSFSSSYNRWPKNWLEGASNGTGKVMNLTKGTIPRKHAIVIFSIGNNGYAAFVENVIDDTIQITLSNINGDLAYNGERRIPINDSNIVGYLYTE